MSAEVVTTVRRMLALALIAGLTLMNVQAAELHMHSDVESHDVHQHGPASHHHDADHDPSDATQAVALDGDDTVVHVALAAASPSPLHSLHCAGLTAPLFASGIPSTIDAARIVPRAHGPPSTVQHSLRAPPSSSSL